MDYIDRAFSDVVPASHLRSDHVGRLLRYLPAGSDDPVIGRLVAPPEPQGGTIRLAVDVAGSGVRHLSPAPDEEVTLAHP